VFIDEAEGEKPIVPLETLASQFAIFDGLALSLQELMLKDALVRIDDFQEHTQELIDAWTRGDEADLQRRLLQPLSEFPELDSFYDAVFWKRNDSMTARLVEIAADGQTRFVVLGAGHMVGERGIPSLLAQRGFSVERVATGAGAPPCRPRSAGRPGCSAAGCRRTRAARRRPRAPVGRPRRRPTRSSARPRR
jgi:uncharacterized protein YbaP (TraB family)